GGDPAEPRILRADDRREASKEVGTRDAVRERGADEIPGLAHGAVRALLAEMRAAVGEIEPAHVNPPSARCIARDAARDVASRGAPAPAPASRASVYFCLHGRKRR